MFIRLKELAQKANTVHFDETVDLSDALKESNGLLNAGPLHISLQALGKEEVAIVTGQLSVDVEQPCSRCLNPVKQTLVIPFHETFARAADESETDDEDEETLFVTDDKIELLPYVMENVMLALPYIPLCDENCLGLCSVCGVDRNLQSCDCNRTKMDPRLAGLADFFKQE
ncbi:YceD family protein [Paenibacillus agricola]|uniref:DUF177 domain-containing protein n=1 Tax=Paenibacillus agricola TaxID=2716264 RepID=A0ABX0IWY5_9BACL|nr:DUF177 domain-containing protein [Paenibacillus agricola]NHN28424.1 DUF177 domain-containing protein [Paenibacillus agricola]